MPFNIFRVSSSEMSSRFPDKLGNPLIGRTGSFALHAAHQCVMHASENIVGKFSGIFVVERQAFIDIGAIAPTTDASSRACSFTGMAAVAFFQNFQVGPIVFGEWMIGKKGIEHVIASHSIHKNQAIAGVAAKSAACSQQLQGHCVEEMSTMRLPGTFMMSFWIMPLSFSAFKSSL